MLHLEGTESVSRIHTLTGRQVGIATAGHAHWRARCPWMSRRGWLPLTGAAVPSEGSDLCTGAICNSIDAHDMARSFTDTSSSKKLHLEN